MARIVPAPRGRLISLPKSVCFYFKPKGAVQGAHHDASLSLGPLTIEAPFPAARPGCSWPERQPPAIDGQGHLCFISRAAFRLWPVSNRSGHEPHNGRVESEATLHKDFRPRNSRPTFSLNRLFESDHKKSFQSIAELTHQAALRSSSCTCRSIAQRNPTSSRTTAITAVGDALPRSIKCR